MAFSASSACSPFSGRFLLAALRAGRSPLRLGRQLRFAGDHDLGRLDDRDGFVAAPQFQLLDGVAGDITAVSRWSPMRSRT